MRCTLGNLILKFRSFDEPPFCRYLTVCHPFFTFSHKWTSNWYIGTIVSFSVVYNLPKFFELQTGMVTRYPNQTTLEGEEGWSPSANMSGEQGEDIEYIYRIDPTEMRINEYYIKVRREEALPSWETGSCKRLSIGLALSAPI